ncbi:MAG: hypothetical protein QXH27_00580 [Candidatus Micrarchaeia archaeon]
MVEIREWDDALGLTPRLDCGLCGLDCGALARRALAGASEFSECIPARQSPQAAPAFAELRRKHSPSRLPEPRKDVLVVRPCIDVANRVSGEANIRHWSPSPYPPFDSVYLEHALRTSGAFGNVKYSPSLGIANLLLSEGRGVVFSRSGKAIARAAFDLNDLEKTFSLVSLVSWPAAVCGECGSLAIDCAIGACNACGACHASRVPPSTNLQSSVPSRRATPAVSLLSPAANHAIEGIGAEPALESAEKRAFALLLEGDAGALFLLGLAKQLRFLADGLARAGGGRQLKKIAREAWEALETGDKKKAEHAAGDAARALAELKRGFSEGGQVWAAKAAGASLKIARAATKL